MGRDSTDGASAMIQEMPGQPGQEVTVRGRRSGGHGLEEFNPLSRNPELRQVLALVVVDKLLASDKRRRAFSPAGLALLELGRRDRQPDEDADLDRRALALERVDRLLGPERDRLSLREEGRLRRRSDGWASKRLHERRRRRGGPCGGRDRLRGRRCLAA